MNQLIGRARAGDTSRTEPSKNSFNRSTGFEATAEKRTPTLPHDASTISPKVAILLCTYHGQTYLAEQLDSFETQSHANWEVWASDDGSADGTRSILEAYKHRWPTGRLRILSGPRKGFVANFLSLACNAGIEADYFAYSDQDDIWETDKLASAVTWLESIPKNVPALYCARTRLIDAACNEIGLSPLFSKPPSFANALIQNIGGGNTMVFNNATRTLLREAGEDLPIVIHDWWVYLVVTGCGGKVLYDKTPTLRYRQHDGNLIGFNAAWPDRFARIHSRWQGQSRYWNEKNITALRKLQNKLTPENRDILERFTKARQTGIITRLVQLKRSGVHSQTLLGNLGLIATAIFGKI